MSFFEFASEAETRVFSRDGFLVLQQPNELCPHCDADESQSMVFSVARAKSVIAAMQSVVEGMESEAGK